MNNSYYWKSPWQWELYLHWSDWFWFVGLGFMFGLLITRLTVIKEDRTPRGYLEVGLLCAGVGALFGLLLMSFNGVFYFFEWWVR